MGIADFSAHQDIAATAFKRARDQFTESAGVADVKIRLTSGIQAGAECSMRLSKLSIGSAEGNDLVLIDNGVAAEQLEMTVKRSLFGTLIDIKALADGLSVNGRPIESGEVSESVKLPASLEIGAAAILLERPENENKNTLGKFWEAVSVTKIARVDPIILLTLAALLVILFGAIVGSLLSWNTSPYAVVGNSRAVEGYLAEVSVRDWQVELETQVQANGLIGDLAISAPQGGIVTISGSVPEGKVGTLREVQTWYDAQPNAPTVIWDVLRQADLRNLPSIMLVSLDEAPTLLLSSGASVGLDDTIVDDWIVKTIGETSMMLNRGSENVTVAYEDLKP